MLKTFHFALTDVQIMIILFLFLFPSSKLIVNFLHFSFRDQPRDDATCLKVAETKKKTSLISAIIRKYNSGLRWCFLRRKCREFNSSQTAGRAQCSPIDLCARYFRLKFKPPSRKRAACGFANKIEHFFVPKPQFPRVRRSRDISCF